MSNILKMQSALMPLVRDGDKKITIRHAWHINAVPGPYVIQDNKDVDRVVHVHVHAITYTTAADIPLNLLQEDGFSNFDEFLTAMKHHYPDFDFNTWTKVTIYQWR